MSSVKRLSRFWTPTGQSSEAFDAAGALLFRAGYVRRTHAGVFQLLPLGYRVQTKIERLLDRHMVGLGASRVSLSAFSSESLWHRSGRLQDDTGELFRLNDRRGSKFLLSPTHEEEITSLVGGIVNSHRDLPLRLYQITRKYRDELRSRAGLLRTREFLMKDLYTFDTSEKEALTTYKDVCASYSKLFEELKIPFHIADADSGSIGGDLCHEYHVLSGIGEDDIVICSNCSFTSNIEILPSSTQSPCPQCGTTGHMVTKKSIELAHAFFLGARYSTALNATFDAEIGGRQPIQMGCYGIGVSRMIAGIAEILRDKEGLNWPRAIAPFEVVVVPADGMENEATIIYDRITMPTSGGHHIDAILDDRQQHFVWKMKDADLIGYPIILVLGRAWQARQEVELQCRRLAIRETLPLASLKERLFCLLNQL